MVVKKSIFFQISEELVCLLVMSLFTYAAVSKLLEYEKFQAQIGQSPLLTAFSGFVVWFIPTVEIIVSLLLAIPRFRTIGLLSAFSLMVLFSTYIIAILNFSSFVPCSCGGVLSKMGWQEHLIFNIVFVFLCMYGSVIHEWNLKSQLKSSGILA